MCGFSILNCILGGQALASVSNQNLSWTYVLYSATESGVIHCVHWHCLFFSVGIVVIGFSGLLVSFCGYAALNWYERVAWLPVLVTFAIALGEGGKHLGELTFKPATARGVLGFASTLAGFTVTWTPLSSDYTAYFRKDVKRSVPNP